MARGAQSYFGPITGLVVGLLLAAANVLLMARVGAWCFWTGIAALGCFAGVIAATLAGHTRTRLICSDTLLALTLLTFNIWAFSHLGNLLYYLGLFFFALFGLIMGAALFRLLSLFPRLPALAIYGTGAAFVLIAWAGGLVLEASYFREDCYDTYAVKIIRITPSETPAEARERIALEAGDHLARLHPAAGTLAYIRWGLTESVIRFDVPGRTQTVEYRLAQGRRGFAARLVLSLFLLSFAVFSQLRPTVAAGPPSDDRHSGPAAVHSAEPAAPDASHAQQQAGPCRLHQEGR